MAKALNDRRAIRTKKMIRNALSELIEEKGFSNISITDLTARADINRGTFYLHYNDKYDLLEQVENEVIQEIHDHATSVGCLDTLNIDFIDKPIPFMTRIFEYFKDNAGFMKAIFGPKGDPVFQRKLKKFIEAEMFEKKSVSTLNKDTTMVPEEYFVSYVLSAHLGALQQWLESGMKESPEEMSLILSRMFFLGPYKAGK
jgi:Transcriptional regulator